MRNPCVAHRGWSGRAPENTMAAIRLAIEEPRVEWVEIDVQLSKDSVPVVIHDYKLRRTTNGRGLVKDWTAEELSALDAGSWFSPRYRGERIPLLEEVLQEGFGRIGLNIELKTDGIRYPHIEERVWSLVKAYGAENDVVITSFHAGALHTMRSLTDGEARTGLIVDKWRESLIAELRGTDSDFLSIEYGKLKPERINRLKEAGIRTMAWTPNEVRAIRKTAALDPDIMICTNYLDRWQEALAGIAVR
ncbi:glycerophosphodiester phosphodiesterase [Paenibacillus sp. NPDC058071]|uniref:glycerophosphodiester phosphodiesterase n=1 Tax=Paenibacillus sp. NPDC058071 TaxID=3346326 RepID=UPI0036DDEAE4